VQYKSKAFEMFQELLSNMRLGVITRMFTFRPRDISSVQTTVTVSRPETPQLQAEPEKVKEKVGGSPGKTKRRRRRR
jgi:preprotein translocase subunit SecA